MCDPVLSVHSQCICTMEIVHHSCAVHRASCMLLTVRYMQRARPNLYATSCKRASRMYRSCSIHLSRTCTVHKMHGCHLQHGGTVNTLKIKEWKLDTSPSMQLVRKSSSMVDGVLSKYTLFLFLSNTFISNSRLRLTSFDLLCLSKKRVFGFFGKDIFHSILDHFN